MYIIYQTINQQRIRTTQSGIVEFNCAGNCNCDTLYKFNVVALYSYHTLVYANIINMDTGEEMTFDGGKFSLTTSRHQNEFKKKYGYSKTIITNEIIGRYAPDTSEYQALAVAKYFSRTFNFTK